MNTVSKVTLVITKLFLIFYKIKCYVTIEGVVIINIDC